MGERERITEKERETALGKKKHQWKRSTERKKIGKETGLKKERYTERQGWEGEKG